jgi:dolichol-phosphate mannosyltransferase
MKKIIVIPTYNERENIEALLRSIFDLGIKNLGVIVVDDGSPDETGEVVKNLMNKYPVELIERTNKLGLGSAYVAGFQKALTGGADLILEMDADFSHQPKYLSGLIEAIEGNGFDVAIGSRRVEGGGVKGWNFFRNIESRLAMGFARMVLDLKTKDVTAGFRCYRSEVLKSLDLNRIRSNGYAFQEEMIYWCEKKGFKIKELPIDFIDRQKGKSKLGFRDIVEFFWTVVRLRFKGIE